MFVRLCKKIVPLLLFTGLLVGCETTHIKLDSVFWENKSSKIAIGITPFPLMGHTYKVINRGALTKYVYVPLPSSTSKTDDFMDENLTRFVNGFDYSEFATIKSIFLDEFVKRGMQAFSLDDVIFAPKFQSLLIAHSNPGSVASLRQETNADYLILFEVKECGLSGVFRPFSTPTRLEVILSVQAYLIDLHSSEDKWKYLQLSTVRIQKDWIQPPDYPNIKRAFHESITKTINELNPAFFKQF